MNAGNLNALGCSLGWTDGSVSLSDPPLQNQKTMLFYCFPACLTVSWRRQASHRTGAGERLMGVFQATVHEYFSRPNKNCNKSSIKRSQKGLHLISDM